MPNILIEHTSQAVLLTAFGEFVAHGFGDNNKKEHLVLVFGDISSGDNILCRVHSECLTGEVFSSLQCDCKEQLHLSLRRIVKEQAGVLVYLRQEGRGIGLVEKLKSYHLQNTGLDTLDANIALGHGADERDYEIAAVVLQSIGVKTIRLLTNNPDKIAQLGQYGIPVLERVPVISTHITSHNRTYINTKMEKFKHIFE